MPLTLDVEGMMCQNSCGSTVHGALVAVPGVEAADVSYALRRARVWGTAAFYALIDAVDAVGFEATLAPDVVLEVRGMMCQQSCGATVAAALQAVRGVARADVSFPTGRALVWTAALPNPTGELADQGSATAAALVAVVEATGFEAIEAPDVVLDVEGMMCQKSCGSTVRRALAAVPGVAAAEVSFPLKTARVWGRPAAAALVAAVEAVGFSAAVAAPAAAAAAKARTKPRLIDGAGAGRDITPMATPPAGGTASPLQRLPATKLLVTAAREAMAVFSVEGMSCESCAAGIESAVSALRGVLSVQVALAAARADVTFDSAAVTEAAIASAIVKLRYKVHHLHTTVAASAAMLNSNGGVSPSGNGTDANAAARADRRAVREMVFEVTGMSCASCSAKIERALAALPGVTEVAVSVTTGRCRVAVDPAAAGAAGGAGASPAAAAAGARDIVEHIRRLGFGAAPAARTGSVGAMEAAHAREVGMWKHLFLVSLALTAPIMAIHMTMHHDTTGGGMAGSEGGGAAAEDGGGGHDGGLCGDGVSWGTLAIAALSTPVQFGVGGRFYRNAWRSARHGSLGMDFLVAFGTTCSYVYSAMALAVDCLTPVALGSQHFFFESSAMLLTFITLGKYLEAVAKGKTSQALTLLMRLQPRRASLVRPIGGGAMAGSDGGDGGNGSGSSGAEGCGDNGADDDIELTMVQPGDVLRVVPGAQVPTDGVVVSGSSYVDLSMITGEPLPVLRRPGDELYGGTVNQAGMLLMRATRVGDDTLLAQIARLVEEAQLTKAPIQAYADRIAGVFVPAVMAVALVTFVAWYVAAATGSVPASWMERGDGSTQPFLFALLFAISVTVVACPCALGLATPTAVMVGTGVGAANGVLIKGGPVLETAQRVSAVIFDKTGTLTTGKAVLTDEVDLTQPPSPVGGRNGTVRSPLPLPLRRSLAAGALTADGSEGGASDAATLAEARSAMQQHTQRGSAASGPGPGPSFGSGCNGSIDISAGVLDVGVGANDAIALARPPPPKQQHLALALAAACEQGSEHPVAQAVVKAALSLGLQLPAIDDFEAAPGMGVAGQHPRGWVLVGNRAWMGACGVAVAADAELVMVAMELEGKTAMLVALDGSVVGVLGVADQPKSEARGTVAALRSLGLDVWLVTGDNHRTAAALATAVGITADRVAAEVLPADKAAHVRRLQAGGAVVAMVGDGVNDAPALAAADVGIAVGAGTAVAMEAAGMVLVRNHLHDAVVALHLSRRVFTRIRLNFVFAMAYNVCGIPFAAGALYPFLHLRLPPAFAGLSMALSSISVVLSSLALRLYERPEVSETGRIRERGCVPSLRDVLCGVIGGGGGGSDGDSGDGSGGGKRFGFVGRVRPRSSAASDEIALLRGVIMPSREQIPPGLATRTPRSRSIPRTARTDGRRYLRVEEDAAVHDEAAAVRSAVLGSNAAGGDGAGESSGILSARGEGGDGGTDADGDVELGAHGYFV